MEEVASVKGCFLKKGTGIDSSFRIDATGELGSTTEIQAKFLSLLLL
jgi:hypothetical protein